jgi:hypothetical protein
MLSTKKFVSIVTAVFLIVGSFGFAFADDSVYSVAAVVVSYETTSFGDLEIEVIDANGEVWVYFADEAHFGDLVILKIFDFEELGFEDDEILDVITIGRLTDHEIVQWLIH